jgi:radical SAM superfamily enzyme YgiQ (UPF0313 family)
MRRLRIFLARAGFQDLNQLDVSPPIGLLYLAAYVRERLDVDIRVVDQRAEGISNKQLVQQAVDFEADVVGFNSVTCMAHLVPELVSLVRTGLPDALVLLGGPHASAFETKALEETGTDMVVVGEGELSFQRILEAYLDGRHENPRDYSDIPGLIWRDSDGQAVTNPGMMPFIEDLDSLPMPAYDLIDIRKYWKMHSFVLVPRRRYISLLTSRGCPFQCFYCHNVFGKRFRGNSPARMADEVEYHVKKYGADDVEFVDDIFNYDYERVLDFCTEVAKRNVKFKIAFPNGVRTDALSEEMIDALVDTGLYYCSVALESGSPRIQKFMGKHLNIPSFLENVEILARRGVFTNGFSMLGFPTETETEVRQTIDVMLNSRLHGGHFFSVTPFPGNELHEYVARNQPEKLVGVDFYGQSYQSIRVNLSEVPDALLFGLQRQAYRKFYLNPRRIARILRAYPKPHYLPYYLPLLIKTGSKGLLQGLSMKRSKTPHTVNSRLD